MKATIINTSNPPMIASMTTLLLLGPRKLMKIEEEKSIIEKKKVANCALGLDLAFWVLDWGGGSGLMAI